MNSDSDSDTDRRGPGRGKKKGRRGAERNAEGNKQQMVNPFAALKGNPEIAAIKARQGDAMFPVHPDDLKQATQRSTMLCYFMCVFLAFGISLVAFLEEKRAEAEDGPQLEDEGGASLPKTGLIMSGVGLGIGICALFVVPIFQLHWAQLKQSGRLDQYMKRPDTPEKKSVNKVSAIDASMAERLADEITEKHGIQAEYRGPETRLKFSYRAKNIDPGQFENPVRDRLLFQEWEQNRPRAPNLMTIEMPEDEEYQASEISIRLERCESRTMARLSRPQSAPVGLRQNLNGSRPESSMRMGVRPSTAVGGGADPHQVTKQLLALRDLPNHGFDRSVSGQMTPGGRMIHTGQMTPGGRMIHTGQMTPGGRRTGHGATPVGSARGTRPGSAPQHLAVYNQAQAEQLALSPFYHQMQPRTAGGMPMSGNVTSFGGVEDGLWSDIPGYDEAQRRYAQQKGSTSAAGRPMSGASTREIYTPDLYMKARQEQAMIPKGDNFNPIRIGQRWKDKAGPKKKRRNNATLLQEIEDEQRAAEEKAAATKVAPQQEESTNHGDFHRLRNSANSFTSDQASLTKAVTIRSSLPVTDVISRQPTGTRTSTADVQQTLSESVSCVLRRTTEARTTLNTWARNYLTDCPSTEDVYELSQGRKRMTMVQLQAVPKHELQDIMQELGLAQWVNEKGSSDMMPQQNEDRVQEHVESETQQFFGKKGYHRQSAASLEDASQ